MSAASGGGGSLPLKADFKAGLVSKGDESEKTSRVVGAGGEDTGSDAGGWREELEPESRSGNQPNKQL